MPEKTELAPEKKVAEIVKDFKKLDKKKDKMIVVESEEDYAQANEFLVNVKNRINRVKEIHKEYVKPLKDHVKKLDELFKEPQRNYEAIEATVKRAMSDFRLEQNRIAAAKAEKERKEREEAEAEAARLAEEAKAKGEPAPEPAVAPAPAPVSPAVRPTTTHRTDAGKSSEVTVVKFEIEDILSLPKKYRDAILEAAAEKGLAKQVLTPYVKADGMKFKAKGVRVYEDVEIRVTA